MSETRALAIIRDYEDLNLALRKRAESLNVSRQVIDDVSGLQSGYSSKLLANPPMRTLGPVSLGPMLGALGTMLILVEDQEMMDAIARRLTDRNRSQMRGMLADGTHALVIHKFPLCRMANLAALGGKARARKMTKRQRSKSARNAANKRWSTPKIEEIPLAQISPTLALELENVSRPRRRTKTQT